jgi:hypothetical protein
MEQNPSAMESMLSMMDEADKSSPRVDMANYNYSTLKKTIKSESTWVVQLDHMGTVDANGRPVPPEEALSTPGTRQIWVIYCYDDRGVFRAQHECRGLPSEDDLLECV